MDLNKELDGRVIYLAGASGGVGLETAKMLLMRGANVLMHYRTKSDSLKELLSIYGPDRVRLTQGDLTVAVLSMLSEWLENVKRISVRWTHSLAL